MGTTFFLVRHAAHDLLGRILTGRMPGVHLAETGHAQARRLAEHFAGLDITAVHTSPRERAEQTARPIAARLGVACEEVAALDEIELGEWTGCEFPALDGDPRWQDWNERRSTARAPGGESMAEVRDRIVGHLAGSHAARPGGRLVLVSHADVIKAALLHFLGATLDAFWRIEIAPAAISTVVLDGGAARILGLNQRVSG